MSEQKRKKALLGIFIVLLCDLTSFGMVIPLTPILARDFGADGFKIGLLISCYSFIQFLVAPFWGRLSDIFGRKNIILLGFLGSSLAHLLFAFSHSFEDIFLSRALAGFFGGNVVIGTAYIADISSVKIRSKSLALIGMAFGAGFTIGPLLGWLFIFLGGKLGSNPPYGAHFASMGASLLCLINCITAFFFLTESLAQKKKLNEIFAKTKTSFFARPSLYMIWTALKTSKLGVVLIMSFILWFALAQIEPVLILLVQDDFLWNKKTAYSSFIYIGLLMVLSQGFLVRKWIPLWGEKRLNQWGLGIMSLGLLGMALSGFMAGPSDGFLSMAFVILFLGVSFFSIGYSLSNTCLTGALSLMTSAKKQGSIFGVNQSLSAMARMAGPALGGWLYQKINHESPFLFAGFCVLGALALAFYFKQNFPQSGKTNERLPS